MLILALIYVLNSCASPSQTVLFFSRVPVHILLLGGSGALCDSILELFIERQPTDE